MATEKHIDISGIKHLYPFRSNYTEIKGIKFHYIDEGSGNPVLMIHGNPTWSFYFRSLIKELSPDFRTIAPDHIGCGLSGKPEQSDYDYRLKSRIEDIGLFLRHLKLTGKINLILHDWGGMIGMAYAIENPQKIRSVVIMNSAAFLPPGGQTKIPLRLGIIRNIAPFANIAVLGFNLFAKGALYMASYKGLSKDAKTGLTAPYNSWRNRIATLRFVQDIPLVKNDPSYDTVKYVEDNLHRLADIPFLICWGMHDFVFTKNYLAEWQRRFPKAETHIFENAGHYVLEDEPEKISFIIKDFLNRHII